MSEVSQKELPTIENYRELFLNDIPMLDVRAPVEFDQGAFPHTTNIPLMNDEEREAVGIRYKELGQDKAIELGHELVSGATKQQRIQNWSAFFNKHPDGVLYCFRGGLRSRLTQQWIAENTGVTIPRVKGGYKALRRFLIDQLESNVEKISPVILGGRTGIGKTLLLNEVKQKIDLEGIFHHRGSVFGKHVTPQPAQIDIENQVSIELLKLVAAGAEKVLLEDEAPNIGSRNIPRSLFDKMRVSPLILLEESVDNRINITFDEYITNSLQQFQDYYGEEQGFAQWAEQLVTSLEKIKRRLGGERFVDLSAIMNDAITNHRQTGDSEMHRQWIKSLLVDYYDPMYDYQLTKKSHRVVFQGTRSEIKDYFNSELNLF